MPGPNDEQFCAEDFAGTPLLRAIEELSQQTSRPIASFETMTMGQVVGLAQQHYGEQLPEIWRIWIDWNQGDQTQPMGDL